MKLKIILIKNKYITNKVGDMSDDKNINEDNKKPIDSNIKDYKSIKLSKENNFSFKSKGSISKNKDNYCKCFNESINECNN